MEEKINKCIYQTNKNYTKKYSFTRNFFIILQEGLKIFEDQGIDEKISIKNVSQRG